MLTICGLHASIRDKEIIRGLDLTIKDGEVHAIMGPNGSGKSTLAGALMGNPSITAGGSVKIGSLEVLGLPADERARLGLFLAFQNPEEIEGVKLGGLLRRAIAAREGTAADMDRMVAIHEGLVADAKRLGIGEANLGRELNVGFSGGEKKRSEALQMLALKPGVIVLDEIDSGLDVDGLKMLSKALSEMQNGKRCFLIITHYPRILHHVRPDRVHILIGGRLVESGGVELAHEIERDGYSKYLPAKGDG